MKEKRILVVDDDNDVRGLIAEVLRTFNYMVLEARSGEEAIELSREGDEPIDLLITDYHLPEINGPELIQRMRVHRPDLRSMLMTGELKENLTDDGNRFEECEYLHKPFNPDDLLRMVDQNLGYEKATA